MSDCRVDVIELATAYHHGFRILTPEQLKDLADVFIGDFLDGLTIERNPSFETWLLSQRRRFRDIYAALLEHIVQRFCTEDARLYLDRWMRLSPFDLRPHELLLTALAAEGRVREGEEHLAASIKLFSSEGMDVKPLREIWRTARAQADETFKAVSANPLAAIVPAAANQDTASNERRRASIAVMPFNDASAVAIPGGPSDALVHDIITRLAKLRSLHVIAQGTMFTLRGKQHAAEEVAQMLGVDYVVNGTFHRLGDRVSVRVELMETKTGGVAWAEGFERKAADIFTLLDDIGLRIVIAIEREIETLESNRAVLKPPGSLDAWEAHHRGLWHVYRFTRADNDQAQHFFQTAVKLDPTFARAHAGLSFTHWQSAFQRWNDRNTELELAYRTASQSMMIDDRDPTAHWALGRAVWLRGMHDQSVDELHQAIALSPNYALAYYCLAFIQAQSGDPEAAIVAADRSQELSPFDPLLFGMLASRAMALIRLGRLDEAADWAVKAARRPNAHAHILAIAALALSLAGRIEEARLQVQSIRLRYAGYNLGNFFSAFHILPANKNVYQDGAKLIGLA
jgi:TolB-like protein/Tfp pilus assembly protein PilF